MHYEKLFLTIGYILFCYGTLLGIPHGISKGKGSLDSTEKWRVAHLSTCVGGIAIISLVYALTRVFPAMWVYILSGFSLSAYLFSLACTLSGITNLSWYGERKIILAKVIYWIHIAASFLAIAAVIAGLILLLISN